MNPEITSRRRFLGEGLAGLGVLSYLGGNQAIPRARAQSSTPSVASVIDRAVKFLRPRQDAKGVVDPARSLGLRCW